MQYDLTSLMPVMPEIFLLTAACIVLVVDLFLTDHGQFLSLARLRLFAQYLYRHLHRRQRVAQVVREHGRHLAHRRQCLGLGQFAIAMVDLLL